MFLFACNSQEDASTVEERSKSPFVMVLGIAQDAGYPQINCKKKCCYYDWKPWN